MNLGIGTITKDNSKGQILIRDRKKLESVIFPIFDKYPLLSHVSYSYTIFKKAHFILESKNFSLTQKNAELNALLNYKIPKGYISPAISDLNKLSKFEKISSTISVPWLVGFFETKDIFSIVNIDNEFSLKLTIEKKHDKLLLQLVKRVLHVKNNVFELNNNYYVLTTLNSKAISNVINLFKDKFKGMQSLIFKLWSRANIYKKNHNKMVKIYRILTKLNNKSKVKHYTTPPFNAITKRNFSTTRNNRIEPILEYSDLDSPQQKNQIFTENKDKGGVYRWKNNLNGKSYVGSSINLPKRFAQYYGKRLYT